MVRRRFAHTCIRQLLLLSGCVVLSAACASQTFIKPGRHGLGATGPGGGLVWYARDGVYIEAATLSDAAGFDEAKRLASAWRGGGLTDWRAATKGELIMLSHYYKDSGGTVSGRFWSGSYDGTHETRFVWFVDLTSGTAYHNSAGGRQARYGVLAIRQWSLADASHSRTGTRGTAGPAGGVLVVSNAAAYLEISPLLGHAGWNDAVRLAAGYRGGGQTDWRLPNRDEMRQVYEQLAIKKLGGLGPDRYWTAEPSAVGQAWFVDLADGKHYASGYGGLESLRPVRAVRGKLPE